MHHLLRIQQINPLQLIVLIFILQPSHHQLMAVQQFALFLKRTFYLHSLAGLVLHLLLQLVLQLAHISELPLKRAHLLS